MVLVFSTKITNFFTCFAEVTGNGKMTGNDVIMPVLEQFLSSLAAVVWHQNL